MGGGRGGSSDEGHEGKEGGRSGAGHEGHEGEKGGRSCAGDEGHESKEGSCSTGDEGHEGEEGGRSTSHEGYEGVSRRRVCRWRLRCTSCQSTSLLVTGRRCSLGAAGPGHPLS